MSNVLVLVNLVNLWLGQAVYACLLFSSILSQLYWLSVQLTITL